MIPIEVTLENWPESCLPYELKGQPLFVTDRKLVGREEYGFGQHSVLLNGVLWVNELYVRVKKCPNT